MRMKRSEKILVVDDDEKNRTLLHDILTLQYSVKTARNGQEALEALSSEQFHLVVMDIKMPVMDGLEACSIIKSIPGYMPVILITGLRDTEHKIKGISAGADEYLGKPFNTFELLARVGNLIERKRLFDKMEQVIKDIDTLASYSQEEMQRYDAEQFSFPQSVPKLFERFLYDPQDTIKWGNEYFITISPSYLKTDNQLFWKEKKELKQKAILLPEKIWDYLPAGKLIIQSSDDKDIKELMENSLRVVLSRSFDFKNLFAYVENKMGIVAVNFEGIETRFHAILFKEIALIINFFRTISIQIKEINDAFKYMISALSRAAEAHDDETGNHIIRVNEYSKLIAEQLGLDRKMIDILYYSAQMHDVGKIMVPSEIIRKPAPLTKEEFEIIKTHTIHGVKILGSSSRLSVAREVALYHHEKYDGSGYPSGIKGENIPITGRIVMLADIYDALRSKRPYKRPFTHPEAVACIVNGDGRTSPGQFDPFIFSFFKRKAHLFEEIWETLKDEQVGGQG